MRDFHLQQMIESADLPAIPDDDADFTPDLARKIISKYQELLSAPAASTGEPVASGSFDITWQDGAYYVSIPNYQGGTVYTQEIVDPLVNALRNARNYIDAVVMNATDKRKRQNYAECLRIIEDALKPVGGNSFGGVA